jgi:hypothetical protein
MTTYREALARVRADIAHLEHELDEARRQELDLVREMLERGASYREMGELLHVSPSTVLRRFGAKGHANTPPSALDLSAPRRKPGVAGNGPSRPRYPAATEEEAR